MSMQILIARLDFDIAGNYSGSRKKSNAFKQFLLKRKSHSRSNTTAIRTISYNY